MKARDLYTMIVFLSMTVAGTYLRADSTLTDPEIWLCPSKESDFKITVEVGVGIRPSLQGLGRWIDAGGKDDRSGNGGVFHDRACQSRHTETESKGIGKHCVTKSARIFRPFFLNGKKYYCTCGQYDI